MSKQDSLTAEFQGRVFEVGDGPDGKPMVAVLINEATVIRFPASVELCRAWATHLADDIVMSLTVAVGPSS